MSVHGRDGSNRKSILRVPGPELCWQMLGMGRVGGINSHHSGACNYIVLKQYSLVGVVLTQLFLMKQLILLVKLNVTFRLQISDCLQKTINVGTESMLSTNLFKTKTKQISQDTDS